jgi:hypothetical protein
LIRASRTGDSRRANELTQALVGMGLKQIRFGTLTPEY